jgi:hypothetical protein
MVARYRSGGGTQRSQSIQYVGQASQRLAAQADVDAGMLVNLGYDPLAHWCFQARSNSIYFLGSIPTGRSLFVFYYEKR